MSRKFELDTLDFFVRDDNEMGISKDWILKCCFDKELQNRWCPRVGDIILGCTGNLFVISGKHRTDKRLGGDKFFFGGGLCNRDGGNFMDSTFCYTLNKDGMRYSYKGESKDDLYYSKFSDFRWIPRPENELKRARI